MDSGPKSCVLISKRDIKTTQVVDISQVSLFVDVPEETAIKPHQTMRVKLLDPFLNLLEQGIHGGDPLPVDLILGDLLGA